MDYGGVAPTLNAFDNATESRATVVAFSHTQGLDPQASEETTPTLCANGNGQAALIEGHRVGDVRVINNGVSPTVKARWGTGGGNVPAVAYDEYNDAIASTHHTLRAGTKQSTGVVADATVRRLTPVECERLQGFPDNWTAERFDERKETIVKQADSARYKQMGNAVAVPVFEWVIARLVAHERET